MKATINLDSGATKCFVSPKFISEIITTKTHSPFTVKVADGRYVEVTQKVNMTVSFQLIPHKTFNVKAFVLNGIPVDILLGLDFMKTHEMKLDMTTETVQIEI